MSRGERVLAWRGYLLSPYDIAAQSAIMEDIERYFFEHGERLKSLAGWGAERAKDLEWALEEAKKLKEAEKCES